MMMKKKIQRFRPSVRLLLLALVTVVLSNCGHTIRAHKEHPARQKQWASAVSTQAMMCLITYHPEAKGGSPLWESAKPVDEEARAEERLVRLSREVLADRGWKLRDQVFGESGSKSSGLQFDVWERKSPQREIVFAFRGTDGFTCNDWYSNLRWFRARRSSPRREQDQYEVVREKVKAIHDEITTQSGSEPLRWSMTGHSLGGGLAQHAYYTLVSEADRVIVFDSSPVTGFRDFSQSHREMFDQMTFRNEFPHYRVLRVHERGEILSYARNGAAMIFEDDTLMRVIEFEIERKGNPLKQHSMARLVAGLLKIEGENTGIPVSPE